MERINTEYLGFFTLRSPSEKHHLVTKAICIKNFIIIIIIIITVILKSYLSYLSIEWVEDDCFSLQELRVYLSEESHFTDFDNPDKLIWHQKGLKYGTWTDGPDKDGSRTLKTVIEASEVRTISLIR